MLMKEKSERNTLEMVSVETLVPQDHLLRKIDSAVDFTHIYDFVEELYCADNGRPSVDPVVLFKMVLIQHLYGIPSLGRVTGGRWWKIPVLGLSSERSDSPFCHHQL